MASRNLNMDMASVDISEDTDKLIFPCPHCNEYIIVYKNELNCRIFRHAVYIDTCENINPHMPENECMKLVAENKIYGCAKPFQITQQGNSYIARICGYI